MAYNGNPDALQKNGSEQHCNSNTNNSMEATSATCIRYLYNNMLYLLWSVNFVVLVVFLGYDGRLFNRIVVFKYSFSRVRVCFCMKFVSQWYVYWWFYREFTDNSDKVQINIASRISKVIFFIFFLIFF